MWDSNNPMRIHKWISTIDFERSGHLSPFSFSQPGHCGHLNWIWIWSGPSVHSKKTKTWQICSRCWGKNLDRCVMMQCASSKHHVMIPSQELNPSTIWVSRQLPPPAVHPVPSVELVNLMMLVHLPPALHGQRTMQFSLPNPEDRWSQIAEFYQCTHYIGSLSKTSNSWVVCEKNAVLSEPGTLIPYRSWRGERRTVMDRD